MRAIVYMYMYIASTCAYVQCGISPDTKYTCTMYITDMYTHHTCDAITDSTFLMLNRKVRTQM